MHMLQYDVRRRISADESLKSHYFDSLGHAVHSLADSLYLISHLYCTDETIFTGSPSGASMV